MGYCTKGRFYTYIYMILAKHRVRPSHQNRVTNRSKVKNAPIFGSTCNRAGREGVEARRQLPRSWSRETKSRASFSGNEEDEEMTMEEWMVIVRETMRMCVTKAEV